MWQNALLPGETVTRSQRAEVRKTTDEEVGMNRQELPLAAPPRAVDVGAIQAALAGRFGGEVRFDRLSRALYSTDASVYQIVPLGVLLPRTEADIAAALEVCRTFRVPLTARGGGTSQAGQCIGPGLVLDCSKYLSRVLEINPAGRWARVQPGCVLDDLNLEVRPHSLQFAPDISTSNRATLGGMIANNASGTHSVIHGKTLDHVLELKVLLADGTVAHLRPLDEAELRAACARSDLEGAAYRLVRRLAAEHAAEIERRYPKILRRVGGYNLDLFVPRADGSAAPFNLAGLFVGSEGTLGLTLEAKLRLIELPRSRGLLVVHFTELLDALGATPDLLAHGPAAVEVIDRYVLDSTRLNPEASRLRDFIRGDPAAILIVEFYADRADDLPARLDALEADLRRRGHGYHVHRTTDGPGQARIWKLRKAALGLSMAEKGDAKALSFVEDTAVAPDRLRDYIGEFLGVVKRHGTTAGVYAHASVGCLHVRPVIDLKTAEGVRRFEAIAAEVAELVLRYGGALSGEHGDGLVRSPFQEKMYGPALYSAFRELKKELDPLNLLNPGKIVDAPPLASNLRYGAGYVTPEVATTFDFGADGGVVRAAELCAGVGECRKKREGTMCPSYQATRDEQHSTRGRANALRLAMTGQLGLHGLTAPEVHAALDLCLECKACKAECPTNVDMARLKAESLHQYHREHGLPWRNHVFGNVAAVSRWGSRLAPVSNWLAQSRLVRWLNEKLLGIDRRRRPPAFVRQTFVRRYAELWAAGEIGLGIPRVLLFPDTFVNYHEPAIGVAAVAAMQSLGCYPIVGLPPKLSSSDAIHESGESTFSEKMSQPAAAELSWINRCFRLARGLVCCGRPMISNGLLDRAAHHASLNVACLHPLAAAGVPIVACEPSCILTIKDDYPALLRGEQRRQAETVAAQCYTFEEFVESRLAVADPPPVRFKPGPKRILVQGHCHQRALVGMGPLLRLLRRIPGAEVIDLDAGCCGMAGSFGYEKEHYEVSRLVGEQRLFPALRQAAPEDVIVAPGFSCRLQIQHFTGRDAVHPAQLLHALLDEQDEP
jgi:FAD/FMN-containing dehydrogenase/Fe-S oxidoreductase